MQVPPEVATGGVALLLDFRNTTGSLEATTDYTASSRTGRLSSAATTFSSVTVVSLTAFSRTKRENPSRVTHYLRGGYRSTSSSNTCLPDTISPNSRPQGDISYLRSLGLSDSLPLPKDLALSWSQSLFSSSSLCTSLAAYHASDIQ